MDRKVIIFDYDGVIADTFPNILAINRMIHREFGTKPFPGTIGEFREIFRKGFKEFYPQVGIAEIHWKEAADIFEREAPQISAAYKKKDPPGERVKDRSASSAYNPVAFLE